MKKGLIVNILDVQNVSKFVGCREFQDFFNEMEGKKFIVTCDKNKVTIEATEIETANSTFFSFLQSLFLYSENFSFELAKYEEKDDCENSQEVEETGEVENEEVQSVSNESEAPEVSEEKSEEIIGSEEKIEPEKKPVVHGTPEIAAVTAEKPEEKREKTIKESLDEFHEKSSSFEEFVDSVSLWLGVTEIHKEFFKAICVLPISEEEWSYKTQLREALDKNNVQYKLSWFVGTSKLVKEHGGKFIDFIKMVRSYSEYFAGTTGKDENLEVADSQPLDTESTEKHQWKYGINILLANMDVNPEGSAAEIAENVTKVLVKTVKEGNGEEIEDTLKEKVVKTLQYTIESTEDTIDAESVIKKVLKLEDDEIFISLDISQFINDYVQKVTNTDEYVNLNDFLNEFKRAFGNK